MCFHVAFQVRIRVHLDRHGCASIKSSELIIKTTVAEKKKAEGNEDVKEKEDGEKSEEEKEGEGEGEGKAVEKDESLDEADRKCEGEKEAVTPENKADGNTKMEKKSKAVQACYSIFYIFKGQCSISIP